MFSLFNFLIAPFVPALWLYTLHRRFVKGKSAASYAGQWGRVSFAMRAFGTAQRPENLAARRLGRRNNGRAAARTRA